MAKKEETLFKERIAPELKKLGYFVKIQQASISGTPDIIGTINGIFIALELKTDKGVASELQGATLVKIIKSGGVGLVVTPRNYSAVYAFLSSLKRNFQVKKSRKHLLGSLQCLALELDKQS